MGWGGQKKKKKNNNLERGFPQLPLEGCQALTRHRKAKRLDANPLTQLLPLCLHFMTRNKNLHRLSYAYPIIMNFSKDLVQPICPSSFSLIGLSTTEIYI